MLRKSVPYFLLAFCISLSSCNGESILLPGNHRASIENLDIEPDIVFPGENVQVRIEFIPDSIEGSPSFGSDVPISTPVSTGATVGIRLPSNTQFVTGSSRFTGRGLNEPVVSNCDDEGQYLLYSFFPDDVAPLETATLSFAVHVEGGEGTKSVFVATGPRLNCTHLLGAEGTINVQSP